MNQEKLDKVYEDFLKLADKKKDITDDDILVLAGADRNVNHHIKLEYLQVTSGVGVRSVASLGLNISGEHFEAAATGNGPVDAAIKAVKQIIKRQMTLKEFTIQLSAKVVTMLVKFTCRWNMTDRCIMVSEQIPTSLQHQ
mgnify:CR=1 FL=1